MHFFVLDRNISYITVCKKKKTFKKQLHKNIYVNVQRMRFPKVKA